MALIVFRWKNKKFTEDVSDDYVVATTKIARRKNFSIDVMLKEGNQVKIHPTIRFTLSPLFHARQTDLVRSMSREPINWDQIEKSIVDHRRRHDLKPKVSLVLPQQFRVIDVERDKVILAPDHCEFVALSYVWGETTSDLMLCTSNVQQLAEDFSISRMDIPATIKDAMIACEMIGKRYLWVDRLCIVQDESDDIKLAQMERMGDVYSSAFLTIVGACGNDARSGLAGIDGKPRTRAPWVISLNKTILVEDVDHPFYIQSEIPKWHTRGWTFQELVLSSRLLIFTDFGVCYMCNPKDRSNGGDEGAFEFLPNNFMSLQIYDLEARNIRSIIAKYSERHLTYDADRVRAFSGIFNHLGVRHQSGMPWNEFDDNLFWRPCLWKQASRTHDSSEAALFPTWSWSSVAGPVKFDNYDFHVPVTTWAHFSPEEGNFFVLIPPEMERYGWHQLAHTERFYDLEHWIALRDCKCKGLNQECCEDCCLDSHTRVRMNMQRRTSNFLKKFSAEDTNAALIPGRLLLLTQTARLRLEYYGTFSFEHGFSQTEFSLWNEDEQWTGIIQLSKYDAEPIMEMCKGGNKAFFDFAAISISYIWDGSSPLHRFFDNTKARVFFYQAPFTQEDEVKLFPESKEKFFQEVRYKGYYKPSPDSIVDELPVLNVMLLR